MIRKVFLECADGHWVNDSDPDAYRPNSFGANNFVIMTDPLLA